MYEGHFKVTYRGIETIKCPFDYIMYQMIVWKLQPDLIIEIGTSKGGTALYLADLLDITGKGEIHTIDIKKDELNPLVKLHPRIKIFTGGYQEYDLKNANGFEIVIVIEDGSHTYNDTISAMLKFSQVVTLNSYMIIEDGIIDELKMKEKYNGGPLKAIQEFLSVNNRFTIDRTWCDMFGSNATFNVDGYLKKTGENAKS